MLGVFQNMFLLSRSFICLVAGLVAVPAFFFVATGMAWAQSEGYQVEFKSTAIDLGQSVKVEWQAPADRLNGAWIGIFTEGTGNNNYRTWKYLPKGVTSGEMDFAVNVAGTYEVRLFSDSGYNKAAEGSHKLVITKAGTVGSDTGNTGSSGSGSNNGNTNNGNNNNSNSGTGNNSTGQYTLSASKSTYEFGETLLVSFTTPSPRTNADSGAWIGIFTEGAGNNNYRTWKYLPKGVTSGEMDFAVSVAGTYEARLFSGSYTKVTDSDTFLIKPKSSVVTPPPTTPPPTQPPSTDENFSLTVSSQAIGVGGSVTVSWEAPTGIDLRNDWVGIYRTGASNFSYLSYFYTNATTNGSATFSITAPGSYEFRYFRNGSYTRVSTSPVVNVSADTSSLQCNLSNSTLQSVTNYPPSSGPIIAFGDSLTAGVGATAGQDYVSQLSRKSGVPIINAGISGNTTRDAAARLQSDVLSRNPSVVIVWLGGNDILQRHYEGLFNGANNPNLYESLRLILLRVTGKIPAPQGITEAETFANLKEIVEDIQDRGAVTIVIGFSGGVFDAKLEALYKKVADETNSIYVPNAMSGIIGRVTLMSDLVHPNNAGYGLVADKVLPYLVCVAG